MARRLVAPALCVIITPPLVCPLMMICLLTLRADVQVQDPFGITTVSPLAAAVTAFPTSVLEQLPALMVAAAVGLAGSVKRASAASGESSVDFIFLPVRSRPPFESATHPQTVCWCSVSIGSFRWDLRRSAKPPPLIWAAQTQTGNGSPQYPRPVSSDGFRFCKHLGPQPKPKRMDKFTRRRQGAGKLCIPRAARRPQKRRDPRRGGNFTPGISLAICRTSDFQVCERAGSTARASARF